MAKQLLGKEVTAVLNEKIRKQVQELEKKGITPKLAFVRVGDRPDDLSYERGASRRCEMLGVFCERYVFDEQCAQEELMDRIRQLNADDSVHGILLFRPLPRHLKEEEVTELLCPQKDVDGVTAASMAGVFMGREQGFPPCTAQACMEILDHYGIDCQGKKAVVVGRSLVVGKPVAMMLLKRNATVTVCHTKTEDLPSVVQEADLVIAAAGCPAMLDDTCVSKGQTIIDVGIHVNEDGKLCGDVLYEKAEPMAEWITPVPGGVGSVTTSVLVGHVAEAAWRKMETDSEQME